MASYRQERMLAVRLPVPLSVPALWLNCAVLKPLATARLPPLTFNAPALLMVWTWVLPTAASKVTVAPAGIATAATLEPSGNASQLAALLHWPLTAPAVHVARGLIVMLALLVALLLASV